MRWTTILLARILLAGIFVGGVAGRTWALREFKKPFEKHYAELFEDEAVKTTFRKAKCNLCHQKGEKKEINNPYGEALSELIEGNAKERLDIAKENDRKKEALAEIIAELNVALVQVESLCSADGTTFGERIKSGQLPVELPAGPDDDEEDDDEGEEEDDERGEGPTEEK
jgi:hypothetical protein